MNKQELIQKLQDIEWQDFEVKEAKAEIPKNVWETVSAFSNTSGWLSYYAKKPVVEGDFDYYKITFYLERKRLGDGEKDGVKDGVPLTSNQQKIPVGSLEIIQKKVENVVQTWSKRGVNVGETEEIILKQIIINPHVRLALISRTLKLSRRTIEDAVARLKSKGILKRIGPDKGGHWEVK